MHILLVFSVLSEDWDCCHAMEKFAPRIGMLLGPCCSNHNTSNAEKLLSIISRLGYILGNIMTNYDLARTQVSRENVLGVSILMIHLHHLFSSFITMWPWNIC